MYLGDIYTISINLAGLPGISVPCGTDSKGLPIGMQLIGDCFKEKTLIRAAYTIRSRGGKATMAKQYETVIGLEVHVELCHEDENILRLFHGVRRQTQHPHLPVCTGMPGSLPVLNKQVVEYAVAVGLATNCTITQYCKFDRKIISIPITLKTIRSLSCICPSAGMAR